jgi:superfamily II DNA/RNA helicase
LKFLEFGLDPRVMEGIEAIGYQEATPVQEKAIPHILEGKDIIASAQTGTGKTAAFLLPLIHNIANTKEDEHIKALVIVPTRELAIQIGQQMEGLGYFTSVSSISVYGGSDGTSFAQEKQALTKGADIVICTPGRMMAHLNMNYVQIAELEYLVLDEADRMLDMGFHDDIMKIISYIPEKRQNLLFSATMPPKMRELARKVLHKPEEINIAISRPPDKILQVAFVVYETQKIPLVEYVLKAKSLKSVLIFCSTKISTKELSRRLKKSGFSIEDIHSDLDQKSREEVLMKFKNRKLNILVATDILSRGIDIEDIDLVINYDVPNDGEDYVHRIGRTARAASKGVAFTFINEEEQGQFLEIEKLLGKPVSKAKIPEEFGPGPEYSPKKFVRRKGGYKGKGKVRRK